MTTIKVAQGRKTNKSRYAFLIINIHTINIIYHLKQYANKSTTIASYEAGSYMSVYIKICTYILRSVGDHTVYIRLIRLITKTLPPHVYNIDNLNIYIKFLWLQQFYILHVIQILLSFIIFAYHNIELSLLISSFYFRSNSNLTESSVTCIPQEWLSR